MTEGRDRNVDTGGARRLGVPVLLIGALGVTLAPWTSWSAVWAVWSVRCACGAAWAR